MAAESSRILSREQVEKLLESVLKNEEIINPRIEIEGGSSKGDGYMSFLTKVDVRGDDNKELHLMIKAAPKAPEFRKVMPVRKIFLREIYFYDRIIKEFNKYQKERGVDLPMNVPKCFKTSEEDGNELLIMDNIKLKGFRMFNRKTQMNEQHINMVFKQYARYHAISYAMKDQNPELFEDITKDLDPILTSETFSPEMYDKFIQNAKNSTSFFDPLKEKHLCDGIDKFISEIHDFFLYMEKYKSKHSVVIHGDCWCNNMMFKYETDEDLMNPKDICLLDFQIVLLSSPMLDLCYFFHVSAPEQILYNYKHHLNIYYENLKEHYEKLGGSPENLPTFEELLEEWKIFVKYGFVMALNLFKAMLFEDDEVMDFTDVQEKNIEFFDIFTRKMKNDDIFEKMVKVLANYMYDHGFF